MKAIFLTLGLIFSSLCLLQAEAQIPEDSIYLVEANISGLGNRTVYLAAFVKSSYAVVDSTRAGAGSFYFAFTAENHPGTYRIYFKRPEPGNRNVPEPLYIEFIWCKETFGIMADMENISQSVNFVNSEENEVLGRFRRYENEYEEKMSALYPLIDRYPSEDDFYAVAASHFLELQLERDSILRDLIDSNKDLYVARLISSYLSLILDPDLKGEQRMEYLRYHFFDKSPIQHPELIYSPVYNYKLIEYLSLYRNQNYSFQEQQEAFIEATDVIMANVSADPELRSFVVEYLLEGFNSFQMEEVQTYIAENYVDETCTTDKVQLAMQRVEGYKKMKLGALAEDIKLRDINKRLAVLSRVNADYVVVMFWASHCEHCRRMIPKLKKWYLEDRPENVEIFAVSIDTVKSNWSNYVLKMKLPWINAHETLGWEGKSATAYNIYATPTLFVLDRKRKILAKPITYRELKREIDDLMRDSENIP